MSKNQQHNDNKLQEQLADAFENEPNFSRYDINVRVVNNHVILSGIVDTLSESKHAVEIAESIVGRGNVEVENNLTVSTDGAVDDDHVHMEVRQELEGDSRLIDISINVNVNQGKVILEGRASSLSQKHIAGEAASKAMGVKDIINNISVIRGPEDEYMRKYQR